MTASETVSAKTSATSSICSPTLTDRRTSSAPTSLAHADTTFASATWRSQRDLQNTSRPGMNNITPSRAVSTGKLYARTKAAAITTQLWAAAATNQPSLSTRWSERTNAAMDRSQSLLVNATKETQRIEWNTKII